MRRRNALGGGNRDDWPAASRAKGLSQCLRQRRDTRVAERNATAGIQHPGTNPARRGEYERGESLAHSAPLRPHRSAEPGHLAPSLRRPRCQAKEKIMKLARIMPGALPMNWASQPDRNARFFGGGGSRQESLCGNRRMFVGHGSRGERSRTISRDIKPV